jgi:hypothetical protein
VFNPEPARQLVTFGLIFFPAWFLIGLAIAVLYHISLYYLDGEYRVKPELSMDILVGVLRGLLYVVAWPAIFYFDRSALHRITMLFRYMNPRLRVEDEELAGYIADARRRARTRQQTIEHARREERRLVEQVTGQERKSYLHVFHENNLELERIWLLMAAGSGPGGGKQMVRLFTEHDMADEVLSKARQEVAFRHSAPCDKCGAQVTAETAELPELLLVRVLDSRAEKQIVEAWGLRGNARIRYQECPECDAAKPDVTVDVAGFGNAAGVVRDLRSGVSIQEDLP